MKDFVEYLERMIEGCDSLGGMEREKATYQSVLKEYRKQCNIAPVVGRSEQSCKHPDSCVMGYYHQIGKYYCSKCQKTGLQD